MKNALKNIFAVAIVAVLTGCATLSKNECLEADWFEIGRRDGMLGKQRSVFQNHYEACLKHQIRADRQAYHNGRTNGLKFFCTEENGFNLGRRGRSYRHVCPPGLESEFLAGFSKGKILYKHESKVVASEKRLKKIEHQIQEKEKLLSSSKLSDEKRAEIRSDLKYLDIEHRDVIRELKYLEQSKPSDKLE